jgi:ubiquinone/menaquinone biosynthesis C-methylase UbiE
MSETFKSIEREGWNERAEVYSGTTALVTTQAIPSLLRAVRPRVGTKLLDICTGPGFAAGAASAIGCDVTGVDFAPEMVELAKARYPQCSFATGDAEVLDQDSGAFDAVICNFGVFHFGEPEKAFAEAWRVTRPGGRYSWSQWLGPDKSEFFAVVFNAVTQNADMDVGLPPAPPPFRFSDTEVAETAMRYAGFEDLETEVVPIVLHAPEGEFMDFFRKFSVRVTMILERQEPEVYRAVKSAIDAGLEAYCSSGSPVVPMPAIVVSGRKPT